ncbi:MAG TPA: hypothetical protein VGM88_02245 [Kofleriaceae bacterium]
MTVRRFIAPVLCALVGVGIGGVAFYGRGHADDRELGARTREWCRRLGTQLRADAKKIEQRCQADTRKCVAPLGEPLYDSPDLRAGAAIESITQLDDRGVIGFCAPRAELSCDNSDVLCIARLASQAADELGAPP